jgi:hypothetical protein
MLPKLQIDRLTRDYETPASPTKWKLSLVASKGAEGILLMHAKKLERYREVKMWLALE